MEEPMQSFREFEVAGWEDTSVCSNYDQHLSARTAQSIDSLLDAAGVQRGMRVLDVATGAGYAAPLLPGGVQTQPGSISPPLR